MVALIEVVAVVVDDGVNVEGLLNRCCRLLLLLFEIDAPENFKKLLNLGLLDDDDEEEEEEKILLLRGSIGGLRHLIEALVPSLWGLIAIWTVPLSEDIVWLLFLALFDDEDEDEDEDNKKESNLVDEAYSNVIWVKYIRKKGKKEKREI